MVDFASLAITGAVVSLLTQFVKIIKNKYTNLNGYFNILVAVILSLITAGVYYLAGNAFWETAGQILAVAGAIYTFLIAQVEKA